MVLLLLWVALDGTALALRLSPPLDAGPLGADRRHGGGGASPPRPGSWTTSPSRTRGSRALRTASAHLAVMLSVTCIAAIDLVYRGTAPPTGVGRVLHVAALVLVGAGLGAGGWLGGHLVFHHGVGVDERLPR